MPKRFTDTQIWEKNWFTRLSCKQKCLVRYLFDRCDNAGVWECNLVLASAYIGEEIIEKDLEDLKHLIKKINEDKYLIIDFIDFQYGVLSEKCNPHLRVLELLKKHNIPYPINESTLPPTLPCRVVEEDKEEYKEKDKDKEKDKEKDEEKDEDKDAIPYVKIIDYLNLKTNKSFKASSQETKDLIKYRWKQGFRLEDFKKVIDNKCASWLNLPEWDGYLRPRTLFSTKFESYLNENPSNAKLGKPFIKAVEIGKSWLEKRKQAEQKEMKELEVINVN